MGDLHDHAHLADITQDGGLPSCRPGSPFPKPIWRLHPPLSDTSMVRAIKTQIIPKVAPALRPRPSRQDEMPPDPHLASDDQPLTSESEKFVTLILGNDEDAGRAYVDSLRARGESIDSILLNLLAPVARQLGEMWETDHTDFANVTLGVSRMQRIMRQLSESFSETHQAVGGGSLLLTTIPGEQHSFGMSMAAEFFRREGWNISIGPFASHLELTSLVQERWFDVVGFSVTSDRRLDELKRDIQTIRRDSRNRNVAIMIGGPMVARLPELGAAMGADMTSVDASTAPRQARELVVSIKDRT